MLLGRLSGKSTTIPSIRLDVSHPRSDQCSDYAYDNYLMFNELRAQCYWNKHFTKHLAPMGTSRGHEDTLLLHNNPKG